MSQIVLIGLNHETAPVEVRECLAFSSDETIDALDILKKTPSVEEAVLLSTCNRVEVLAAAGNCSNAVSEIKQFFAAFKQVQPETFHKSLYVHEGEAAVKHVFRVASSLDSMMVGEPQILGQLKEAYRLASEKDMTGVLLNRLMHRSFFVAKRIRTETGIGDSAVSISYAAIELARKIYDTLEQKKVLLIGAGEMAELAVEHLIRHQVGDILVANRTFKRGLELADRFKGQAIRMEEIGNSLERVDIIISSTGATDYVIRPDIVKKALRRRRNRPLFFIDIAVPRDIDPAINRLNDTYVYDIDDLQNIIEDNIEDRNREAVKGERIVDEAVIRFREWAEGLSVVPTIVALRNKLEAIGDAEIKRTMQSLGHLSDKDRKALHRMKSAMINKVLHDPTMFLKNRGDQKNIPYYLDITRKLFNLDD